MRAQFYSSLFYGLDMLQWRDFQEILGPLLVETSGSQLNGKDH
jgi:hypothetical protein